MVREGWQWKAPTQNLLGLSGCPVNKLPLLLLSIAMIWINLHCIDLTQRVPLCAQSSYFSDLTKPVNLFMLALWPEHMSMEHTLHRDLLHTGCESNQRTMVTTSDQIPFQYNRLILCTVYLYIYPYHATMIYWYADNGMASLPSHLTLVIGAL